MNGKSSNFLPSLWSDTPFGDLRKEMDRALESFFGNRGQLSAAAGDGPAFSSFRTPSVDVIESETAITLTAELPGMGEDDVDLSVHNGILTLKGEKRQETKDDKDNYHIVERRYGSFQRSMRLPDIVDEGAIHATFDKGVLKVSIPKKPGSAPAERKIAIGKG